MSPGVQNVYGITATQVFRDANIPKAMIDPTRDQILAPADINKASQAILNGESVDKRTNDWAAALGMSQQGLRQ